MNYLQLFTLLNSLSIEESPSTTLPASTISVEWRRFTSTWKPLDIACSPKEPFCQSLGRFADSLVEENREFAYPIFFPESGKTHKRAIILLHGLNERSWQKYWTWAHFLCQKNEVPVILFPISFHMNRAPKEWADAHAMYPLMKEAMHQQRKPDETTSYLNFAISMRLIDDPLRFFTSGHQSAHDIISLASQLKQGAIANFAKETTVDFFAYSIGAFLAQTIMVANPDQVFSRSRFFLFCGGALFSDMRGTSKHILSRNAFESVCQFYLQKVPSEIEKETELGKLITNSAIGQAFYAMLSADKNASMRSEAFRKFSDRLYVVSLAKDCVIPPSGIKSAVSSRQQATHTNYEELDFPFHYTHETPFPFDAKPEWHQAINRAFDEVFGKAAAFLL